MEKFPDGEGVEKVQNSPSLPPDEMEKAMLDYEAFKKLVYGKISATVDFLGKENEVENIRAPKVASVLVGGSSELREEPRLIHWIGKEIESIEKEIWAVFLMVMKVEYGVDRKFFENIGSDMSFDLRGYLMAKGLDPNISENGSEGWKDRLQDVYGVVSLSLIERWKELSKRVTAFLSIDPALSRQFEDRFLIIGKIGKGGSGKVYLAWHMHLQKKVAVKIITFKKEVDPIFFDQEISNLASLEHPNIIKVYQAGHSPHQGFLVMQYMEGATLFDVIDRENHLPLFTKDGRKGAMEIMIDIADAVAHLHEKNPPLRHNDIKPANILFDGEKLKLADFGISILGEGDSSGRVTRRVEHSDEIMTIDTEKYITGTPTYIAPEKLLDTPVHHLRSDVYSLGVTYFYLLTGFLPLEDSDSNRLFNKVLNKEPSYLHEHRYDIPPELEQLIMSMLKKSPEQRPDARVIHQELKRLKEAWEADPAFNQQMELQDGPGTHQMKLLLEKRKKELEERARMDTEHSTHADA